MHREKDLHELVNRLRDAAGDNLVAIVLYGSAADHEFHEEHSDLNILCLLRSSAGADLATLQPVGLWWWGKGHPAPVLFTLHELRESADVFAIELLDMKLRHRMLWGDDFLGDLDVPVSLHRLQVERELHSNVIRLRQSFLRSRARREDLTELMIASSSTFAALFRHSLMALGEPLLGERRLATDKLAAHLGLDLAAFHLVLDVREGKRGAADLNIAQAFAAYLDAVARVAEQMDKRLSAPNS